MKNYRMLLCYNGSRYRGWQRLGDSPNTIQGKLEDVLTRLTGQPVEVHGSGRTDAGVHALGQAAHFHCETDLSPQALRAGLNRYLPEDIAVLSLEEAPPRFHSRLNTKAKTYRYTLYTGEAKPVFDRPFLWVPRPGSLGPTPVRPLALDLAAMESAAAALIGRHDFRSFCGNKHMKKSTVRTVFSIDLDQQPDRLTLTFRGDGFLQGMVRILTGTLLEVGAGLRPADSIPALLEARDRAKAGFLAPAEGLTLVSVEY